ncbi:MAG: hypothetical protein ACPHRO_02465 [Nannocystaceae bacterium]
MIERVLDEVLAIAFEVVEAAPYGMWLLGVREARALHTNALAREGWSPEMLRNPTTVGLSAWTDLTEPEDGDTSATEAYALPFTDEGGGRLVFCVARSEDEDEEKHADIAKQLADRFTLMVRLYCACASDVLVSDGARASASAGRGLTREVAPQLARIGAIVSGAGEASGVERGVDMVAVAHEISEILGGALRGVEVEVRAPGPSLWVEGDACRHSQLLLALLLNAVSRLRTPEESRLVIQLALVEPYVDVAVCDDGIPMTDEEFAAFFERDVAAKASQSSLDHARDLALELGGDISLGSHERRSGVNEVRVSFPARLTS